jgi:hypothetical protein
MMRIDHGTVVIFSAEDPRAPPARALRGRSSDSTPGIYRLFSAFGGDLPRPDTGPLLPPLILLFAVRRSRTPNNECHSSSTPPAFSLRPLSVTHHYCSRLSRRSLMPYGYIVGRLSGKLELLPRTIGTNSGMIQSGDDGGSESVIWGPAPGAIAMSEGDR